MLKQILAIYVFVLWRSKDITKSALVISMTYMYVAQNSAADIKVQ